MKIFNESMSELKDAQRRRGIVGYIKKCFGEFCQNRSVMPNLIQGLSMLINTINIDRLRVEPAMTERFPSLGERENISCAKRTEKNFSPLTSHFSRESKRYAFTLAEVLITLGIIGVVAAITISVISVKIRNRILVSQLQKFYSEFSQVVQRVNLDYGDNCDSMTYQEFSDAVIAKMNTVKICKLTTGCFESARIKYLRGGYSGDWNSWTHFNKFVMPSGAFVMLEGALSPNDSENAAVGLTEPVSFRAVVDVNGLKAPNQLGYDVFIFGVRKGQVIPYGADDDSYFCDRKVSPNGYTCAFKVLKEGAINY